MRSLRYVFIALAILFISLCAHAQAASHTVLDDIAVEVPFQGGAMLMYSRMFRLTNHVSAGMVVGGGEIERKFTLTSGSTDLDARTRALILPFVGPKLEIDFTYIGISIGYGAFWARTDLDATGPGFGSLSGRKSGWGSGIYSPLLVLSFYDQQHNALIGLGIGGFLGSSYPKLEASSGISKIETNASPLDTLTLHVSITWREGDRFSGKKDEDF